MPRAGDTRYIKVKETWEICLGCRKGRWLRENNYKRLSTTGLCLKCFNKNGLNMNRKNGEFPMRLENHPNWKGGKWKARGYVMVRIKPDDFFFSMAHKNGYVMEHRLVMAKHLGRCLHPWEFVHHKNTNKADNSLGNLQLSSADGHNATHALRRRIKELEAR